MYIYNRDTGTLHIKGYCSHIKVPPTHANFFDSEKASRDFAGEKIQMCKDCQKKREEKMKEIEK